MSMILFWIVVIVVMLVAELATTALVSLWFVGGGIAALLLALLHLPVWIQAVGFVGVSLLLFFTCRDWLAQHFRPQSSATNTALLIDAVGTVTNRIEPMNGGRILVKGQDWKAVSHDGTAIEEGELVKVLSISGVKMIVIKIPKEID